MPRPLISVTIITLNEEDHIADAIRSVSWAEEVIVVDSGSTDRTTAIAKELGARVAFHSWPGYGQQKNYAQSLAKHDWVLNLDADEVVPPDLAEEIRHLMSQIHSVNLENIQGFAIPRKTFYLGRWIRYGGWYPNYLVRLANKNFSKWTEPAVHEELQVKGRVIHLKSALHHYAFSSIRDQVLTNLNFSRLGSLELKNAGQQASTLKMILKPLGKFLETYLIKRGFLDGLAGFIISINAAHSMFLKYAYLSEDRINTKEKLVTTSQLEHV